MKVIRARVALLLFSGVFSIADGARAAQIAAPWIRLTVDNSANVYDFQGTEASEIYSEIGLLTAAPAHFVVRYGAQVAADAGGIHSVSTAATLNGAYEITFYVVDTGGADWQVDVTTRRRARSPQ